VAGDDLQVHAIAVVLPGIERPVSRHAVDWDERAVDDHERVPDLSARRQRGEQLREASGQQHHRLAHIPPGGGGADAEPRRQIGERLTFAQVRQDQQRPLPRVALTPARANLPAVTADHPPAR
jgi:hypothetical protein